MDMAFRIRDMPANETVFSYLKKHTDYGIASRCVPSRLRGDEPIELALDDVDVDRLRQSVLDSIARYGFSGWRHAHGESQTYGGFSLTHNPDHQDDLNPHTSTLGTPKNDATEFFWAKTAKHSQLKHSYFDTYGFRIRTPASREGYLGDFLDSFTRSMIRSRVGVIKGEIADSERTGWHRDEPVFENLRINIPLQTDANFLFELEGKPPSHLPVGKAYTWDTHLPHRVFCDKSSKIWRIHLVLGFSPWFDYFPGEDTWRPNEYFGAIHPFEMLADGLVSRHIRRAR